MRRALASKVVSAFPIVIAVAFSAPLAHAQQPPLPALPAPAPGAAPSTLNTPRPATPLPAPTPLAPVPVTATPTVAPAPAPPTATIDVTASPTAVTQVSAPRVAAPPQLQLPIDCTGPGTFTHDGFYFRIAIGFGGLGVGGSGPRGSAQIRGVSSNVTLAIGGTPSRGFVVGGAVSSASLSSPASSGVPVDVTDASSGTVAGFVDWFPNEHRGWHVGGLLGLGFMSVSSVGQSDWGGVSLGGGAFGGYDFWIGPQWSLALQAALNFTTQASLKDSNQNDTGYSLGSLGGSIQVGFVYH